MSHPALTAGRAAVITGGASGIGLAAARKLADLGMKICLADVDPARLDAAAASLSGAEIITVPTDVSIVADLQRLHDRAYAVFGEVALLMNNAAIGDGGGILGGDPARGQRILDVNLGGVLHGCQIFGPSMVAQRTSAAIVNTGSKQGITTPPGDACYNVSKAGIKVVTEALAHELRNTAGGAVTVHLLVPGFTFTGLTAASGGVKPDAAWTPEQVVDFMLAGVAAGEFYILCPDNAVTREMDNRRMRWAMDDVIENRPALSRWHPDYAAAFAAHMARP